MEQVCPGHVLPESLSLLEGSPQTLDSLFAALSFLLGPSRVSSTHLRGKKNLPLSDKTSLVAQMVKRLPAMRETRGECPGGEDLLEPTPVFLPGESHGRTNLVGYSPQGRKESDMTEQPHFLFFLE